MVVGIDLARSVLMEESDGSTASRAASHPENDGVVLRVVAALEIPVEVVGVLGAGDFVVASLLRHGVAKAGELVGVGADSQFSLE